MKKGICAKCGEHRWVNQHHNFQLKDMKNGTQKIDSLLIDTEKVIGEVPVFAEFKDGTIKNLWIELK